MQRMAGIVAGVGLALLLGGCGDGAAPTIGEPGGDGEAAPDGAPSACDELGEPVYDPPAEEQPPADPGLTDAQPHGDIDPVGDADPMEQARRWAEQEAPEHFAGIWYEPAEGASVIAFTEDVDAYAAEVRERFGEGWWVVSADHSEAELRALQERIVEEQVDQAEAGHEPQAGDVTGVGVRTNHGRVTVMLLAPSDERLAELGRRYGTEAVCVEVTPMPDEEHAQPAPWAPADDADLSPEATSIDVLVNEVGCAGGAPADGRIAPPEIEYGDDEVVVTIAVIPRPGPQTCPGNPDTEYTLELDEPLGDRQLLDGGQHPPAEPELDRMPSGELGEEERPEQDPASSE